MKRLRRAVLVTAAALLAAAALVIGLDVFWQLPDAAVPRVPGLRNRVEVLFDARGVPTIRARSLPDAFRVEGYLQARERLFQMELARRVAGGEMAELVGPAALPLDRKQRLYGFAQVAEAAVQQLPADERQDVEALSDGINAFIASHRNHWGLEFQLLGSGARSWRPADSVRVLLLMHQQLSESWQSELLVESLAGLPPARRNFLTPTITSEDVLLVPDSTPPPAPSTEPLLTQGGPPVKPIPPLPRRETLEVLGIPLDPSGPAPNPDVGSNGWVLSGARTVSGRPLLANDLHLGFSVPGTWFPLRIELIDGSGKILRWIQGISLPGLPGIVIFQNDRLAIGFTNTGTDVQDLYREPALGERVERIAVKDAPGETLTVQLGRHGPMVRPGFALQWAALDPRTLRLPVSRMMLAHDWESLNAAADGFLGPGQNLLYADADGHIGWRVTGVLPLRLSGDDGRAPRSGTDGQHGWKGYLPPAAMPRVFDPPNGRVVTANQRLVGTSAGVDWPSAWASPTRARRIVELVEGGAKLDAHAARSMELDTVGVVHREVVERLRPLLEPELAQAFEHWDGRAEATSTLFRAAEDLRAASYHAVVTRVLEGSQVPADDIDWYNNDATLLAALRATSEAWRRAGLGDREATLRAAVHDIHLAGPTWGERNRLDLKHLFGRSGGILGALFNPPAPPLSGCSRCVRVATPHFGQSMRFVVDFSDPEGTTLVLPLGVSGHLGSSHRQDELRDWLEGDVQGGRTHLHAPPVGTALVFAP
jgi:penicillin amidase